MHTEIFIQSCPVCQGDGFIVEPVCCGQDYLSGCCGDPDAEQSPCGKCGGSGVAHVALYVDPAWLVQEGVAGIEYPFQYGPA